MKPSELRAAIKAIPLPKSEQLPFEPKQLRKTIGNTFSDQTIDAILSAVIASLPLLEIEEPSYVSEHEAGQTYYRRKVRELLQQAKSASKGEQ